MKLIETLMLEFFLIVICILVISSTCYATPGPIGASTFLSQIVALVRGQIAYSLALIGLVTLGIMLILDPQPGIIRKIIVILFGLLVIATSSNITNFFNITPGLAF